MAQRLAIPALLMLLVSAPVEAAEIISINPAFGLSPQGTRNPSQGGYFEGNIAGTGNVNGNNQFLNQDHRYGAQAGKPDTNLINLTVHVTDLHKPIDAIFAIKESIDPDGISNQTDWLVTVKVINDVAPEHPIQNVTFELFEPSVTDLTSEYFQYDPYLTARQLSNDELTPDVGLRDDFDFLGIDSGITLHEPMIDREDGYPSSSYNTAYSDEHFPDWNANPGGRASLDFGGLQGGGGDLYNGETGIFTFGLTLPFDAFSGGRPPTQYFGLRVTANPEPTSLALAGFGMAAAAAAGARRRRRARRGKDADTGDEASEPGASGPSS